MADDFRVKGLSELSKMLDQLPEKIHRNVLRGALRAGMKPVQGEAKLLAPKDSAEMAADLKIGTKGKNGEVIASLKATGKHGYLATWNEFGVQPHVIPGPLNINGNVVLNVEHPGVQPHPFMRPALDAKASEAVIAAGEYIKQRLSTKHGLNTADIILEEIEDDEN